MSEDVRLSLRTLGLILRGYLAASWPSILLTMLVLCTGAALSVLAPLLFARLIDEIAANGLPTDWFARFGLYALIFALSVAAQRGATYLSVIQAEQLGRISANGFFERLARKDSSFFVEHNPAEIQSAQRQGSSSTNILVQMLLIAFLPGIVSFALAAALLGQTISGELVAIVVIYGVVFIGLVHLANQVTKRFMDAAIDADQQNAKFVGNAMGMIEPLRQSGSVAWMVGRFRGNADAVFTNWRSYARRRILFAALFGLAIFVQLMLTYTLLLPRYSEGTLSIGDMVLFNTLLLQLNMPFEMIGASIDETVRSLVRMAPFARLWSAPELQEPATARPLSLSAGDVAFRDVGYAYENGRGVDGVSFIAQRGRPTFITGETGSGKSTLFKMLQKMIAPQKGEVLVDGTNLSDISRQDWFSIIGIVPQDVQLLNDSLRDNIALGRPGDDAQLRRAAARASILERIEAMQDGFDTVVGERGLKLSGGERQRIAIARALYGDPKILLLDEASSALDAATEDEIMGQLRDAGAELTIIAITHRKSVIHDGDQVVRL